MEDNPGVTLDVFGRNWRFTPEALSALQSIWVGAPATLKTLVINISATKGFDKDGKYTCDYFGVRLDIARNGAHVIVDASGDAVGREH